MEVKKVNLTPGPTPVTSFEVSDPNPSKSMYFRCIFAKIDQFQPRIAWLTDYYYSLFIMYNHSYDLQT